MRPSAIDKMFCCLCMEQRLFIDLFVVRLSSVRENCQNRKTAVVLPTLDCLKESTWVGTFHDYLYVMYYYFSCNIILHLLLSLFNRNVKICFSKYGGKCT